MGKSKSYEATSISTHTIYYGMCERNNKNESNKPDSISEKY